MATTVKKLIELLEPYAKNENALITNHENEDFIHIVNKSNGDVILSTKKPIGYCNRSSGYVYPTEVEDYLGVSPELDENVDLCEITLPNLDEEDNPQKFGKPVMKESKYKKGFEELMCYFDSISDEEKPKISKRLEKLGL